MSSIVEEGETRMGCFSDNNQGACPRCHSRNCSVIMSDPNSINNVVCNDCGMEFHVDLDNINESKTF